MMATSTAQIDRRRPPYGKQMKPKGEVRVYTGDGAWTCAQARHAYLRDALVLPPGDNPEFYKWPVAGLEALVIQAGHCEIQQLDRLARELVQNGATVARVVYGDQMSIYRPGMAI